MPRGSLHSREGRQIYWLRLINWRKSDVHSRCLCTWAAMRATAMVCAYRHLFWDWLLKISLVSSVSDDLVPLRFPAVLDGLSVNLSNFYAFSMCVGGSLNI